MFETIRAHARCAWASFVNSTRRPSASTLLRLPSSPDGDYVASSGKPVAAGDVDLLVRALSMGKLTSRHDGHGSVAIGTRPRSRARWSTSRRRQRAQRGALRTSLGHPAGRRGSEAGRRPLDGYQGAHEPQRPLLMEGWRARTRRLVLATARIGGPFRKPACHARPQVRPATGARRGPGGHRRLRLRVPDRQRARSRDRVPLPDGQPRLRLPGSRVSGVHEAPRPVVPGA